MDDKCQIIEVRWLYTEEELWMTCDEFIKNRR